MPKSFFSITTAFPFQVDLNLSSEPPKLKREAHSRCRQFQNFPSYHLITRVREFYSALCDNHQFFFARREIKLRSTGIRMLRNDILARMQRHTTKIKIIQSAAREFRRRSQSRKRVASVKDASWPRDSFPTWLYERKMTRPCEGQTRSSQFVDEDCDRR
jgi:hypothetical protein